MTVLQTFGSWHRRVTSALMSRCRVCGSRADVMVYDPRGLWAFLWRKTWCPDHCPDHDFVYQRDERGHRCTHCFIPPSDGWRFDD